MSKKYYFEKGSLDTIKLTDFFKKYGIRLYKEELTQYYDECLELQAIKDITYTSKDFFGRFGQLRFEEYRHKNTQSIAALSSYIHIEYSEEEVEENIRNNFDLLSKEIHAELLKVANINLDEECKTKKEEYLPKTIRITISCDNLELDKIASIFMDLFEKYFSQGA